MLIKFRMLQGGLSVKKKEEMSLRKTTALAGVFTDSSCDSVDTSAKKLARLPTFT